MPLGIFLIWPALHLLYSVKETHSIKIAKPRRIGGILLLLFSILLVGQPFGWEQGIFYWLFSLMALALSFVQLRIFQSESVPYLTVLSLIFLTINFYQQMGGLS
jgi:hypothetical protein